MELWRDVKNYEGIYQISSEGRVKRIGKYKNQFTEWESGIILKPALHNRGYLFVQLSLENKISRKYVHRLVAEAFIDNPFNKKAVNHIDGNKQNNSVDNLEWCTYLENNVHAYEKLGKTQKNKKGSKSVVQYDMNNKLIKIYPSIREAQRQTGIYGIEKVCKNLQNRKQAGGFKWKYNTH